MPDRAPNLRRNTLLYKVEVRLKNYLPDVKGSGLVKDIYDLGIKAVSSIRVVDVYWLDAELEPGQLELIAKGLLTDPITQEYLCGEDSWDRSDSGDGGRVVEVTYNPGVTDPLEDSVLKAIRDLNIRGVRAVKTAKKYLIHGNLDERDLDTILNRLLLNPIIQHVVKDRSVAFPESPDYKLKLEYVELLGVDDAGQQQICQEFGFTKDELKAITEYFRKEGRNPTDVELESLAQTWSEHCVHKTFKAKIRFGDKIIDNLLQSTVMKATRELAKPWCLSVFKDNAGVIEFDSNWALCFKVETHNHPSAIEPYGGASTGIGGVVRDVLGTGLAARPILNTDVFCFGPPNLNYDKLPPGVLHPKRIFKGVRAGVADYGNRLGIPTLNGTILFDERYTTNPLVYCGTAGLLPKQFALMGKQQPGDLVVLVGGRTGRDGIRGVTFASEQLTGESTEVSYSAVQIGNPIVEKKLIDTILKARDKRLFRRITDCGGGGLSSAVGEMAAETGVCVYLEEVPLKNAGLSYTEIWVSESQERMVLATPPECAEELLKVFTDEDVEATIIGQFTDDKRLKLFYQGEKACDLAMPFLHRGRPQLEREAFWKTPKHKEPDFVQPGDLSEALLQILGSWNVCSKEWVIRQYDHEVQGGNVLKPLVGKENDGPGDAAIIKPLLDSERGVIISNGINLGKGDIDPYWMAASAIDEALRQIIAVGGSLERVALLDNFCWGNTNRPDVLGALVRAAQACYDMALAYETPFISGKDSLNNEFEVDGKIISVPHTLLISAMAVIENVNTAVSMDFKKAGDIIYIVGTTQNELGGSEYFRINGFSGNRVPKVNAAQAKKLMDSLSIATRRGLVMACHDLSEGGIGVALAEMAFAGGLGATIHLESVPLGEAMDRDDFILYSESNSRFLVEVAPEYQAQFEEVMKGISLAPLGQVTDSEIVEVYGLRGKKVLSSTLCELKEAWQKPIRW